MSAEYGTNVRFGRQSVDRNEAEKIRQEGREKGVYVQLKDVSFSYKDGRNVFRHASLIANPGEIVALIGPSGQGKTTTLRMLLGLIRPESGIMKVGNPEKESLEVTDSFCHALCH